PVVRSTSPAPGRHTLEIRGNFMSNLTLPDFLPGTFAIERGTARDYDALADFHYVARRPATFAGVWVVRFTDRRARRRVAAVGVLSYPVPSCASRERFLGLTGSR